MPSKFQFITELYGKTLSELTDRPENWTGFLRAACFNYKCPFDEQVLIYAQRPDSTAVLELDKWNKQFGRWINHGAHGIAVFADDKGNGRLKHYFDVSDTHASRYSRPLPIWEMDMRYDGEVIEALENTFGDLKEKGTLVEAVFSASNNAVADNISDYLHDLKSCVEDSFLEELDELNIEVEYRQLLETSVAYMLLTRLSIDADDYITREDFVNLNDFNTPPTINALGIATGDIAEMGLREISRTVISLRKEQFFEIDIKVPYDNTNEESKADKERSNYNGSDLQNRGRLQDAQPVDAQTAGSASGQVRGTAQTVSDETPQSALHEPQDNRKFDGTSGRNRETGNDDNRADNLEDGSERGRDGEPEADRSFEVDRPYEQLPAFSGGNSLERPDLQLNNTDEAGGENELPAFLDERFMQAIVLDEGGRKVKRQEIFGYFQSHTDYKQRCEFLKNAYTETYVEILVDETRVGYKKQENGLLMWEGSYLSKTSASVFSWGIITEITENLIERGEYKIQLGIQDIPSVTEQLTLFDMGGNVPVYEIDDSEPIKALFPEKAIPQEVVDRALYTAGNEYGSVLRVVVQYMRERSEDENIAFLRREFGKDNGRGIEYDGHKYAVWFTKDGIRFADGNSVRTGLSRTTVSWGDCSKRILELLNEGSYVSQNELDSSYETVLKSCADGLIYIARDLSDEGIAQNLFPIVRSIYEQKMGFPDCSDNLAAYLQEGNGISEISEEYLEFLKEYEENREISRFRVSPYNTHRIDLILGGAARGKRELTSRPDFIRQCKMFITQDEVEQYFLSGSKDSSLDTYSNFCLHLTPKEKQDFIKSDYGSCGGGCNDGYSYSKSSKGLTYERSYGRRTYETIQLTFSQIVKIYDKLIAEKRFPSDDALANIPEYQVHQVARSVYAAFYGVSDDVPRPYPARSDYYDGVPAIEKQLSDSARVQEMLTTIKSILDSTEPGDRYYETRAEANKVLSEYAAGTYDLFNGRHPELTAPRKENRTAEEHRNPLTKDDLITEYGSLFVSKVLFDEPYMAIREGFADDELSRKACGEAVHRVAQTFSNDMRFTEFLAMTEWPAIGVLTDYAFDKTYMDFVKKFGREETQESEYLSLAPSSSAAADAYSRYKADNPNYLLAIQMGAFYELYGEDAVKASEIIGTNLLTRELSDASVSMTGFPDNMWQSYSKELWQRGNNVLLVAQDSDGNYNILKEHRAEMYIPVGTRLDIEERRFEVEKVDFLSDKVSLRDVTFENAVGFPISRIEPIEFVRSYYEEQLPQIIENSIDIDSYLNSEIAPFTDSWQEQISQKQSLSPPAPRRKTQSASFAPANSNGANFRIADDQLGTGSAKEKFQRNIEAIEILNRVELGDSLATPEEQEILSKYVGWGGLSDAFDENKSTWASEYQTLKNTLTAEEYALARESSLTAFYTSPIVIKSIYKAVENMGFSQGNILEPSCGTGNFFGMLPDSMAESKLYGVELDSISGRIAKQLYQKASIAVQSFEKADIPDSFFDVVIGNVPFGQFKVADRRYDKYNFLIHDYFFAKALDKVRPGGVVAFVTSKGTLDKENPAVRKYIAQRADLLGAIRLPNTVFKANAGTEVTSDIIFLQKRDRLIDIEPDWVHLGTDENGIKMNQYFIDNPGMLMGEMQMISGPFGPESACVPYEGQSLENMLSDAVQYIHGEITDYERDEEIDTEDKSISADPTVRNFSYTLVDDKIYYRENSRMHPVEEAVTAENRIRGMIALRDCVRQLIEYQTEDFPDDSITAQQRRLNSIYDSFTEKYGLINSRGNSMAFSEDSSYFLLCSLEIVDEDGNLERKADLFTKRTIRSHKPVEKVDTASEALAVSIGEKARVDMDYMGRLTGKTEEELLSDLKGVVFLNPMYGYGNSTEEKYLPADEYLSGNVRQKLDWAVRSAELNPEDYTVNVEALTQVQPIDLTASEISVRLGATWLPPEIPQQFIYELLGTPRWAQYHIKVHYSKLTGQWSVEGKTQDRGNVRSYSTYGTKRINAYAISEESLNLKDIRIVDYVEDSDGKKTAVLNKKETAIAQAKQELIRSEFTEWVWREPNRREQLCSLYNTIFNSNRPREYDGSHITFNGMNPEITLRTHQINAIAHVLYGGNTLLAHTVGAGKTFEMVAAAMESKRLGLCQKSLFVVPNHLTEQWASEFLQLYPSANILVATKKDFETKNRKKFCGRIATGEYDAVIIGHSQFEKIPMSIERQRAILEQQIDEVLMGINEAKNNRAENFTIKQMEKTRKGLQLRLEKLNDQSRKDDVVTFEELGVDRLFVDESHGFKNLFLYTKMRNVGGVAQTEAQKSSDLFMKCRYLDEITGGRGIIFATGTPISNSMVELYTIQRYLQMSALKEQELQHFDAWASNYGETVAAIELSPEGTGYRAKTRFAKFYNLPELMAMFKNVADIQTADMLNLPVPEAIYHNVPLKPSEYQKDMVASLADRAEKVRNREVESSVDNMLLITNDGRKLALDQRLMNPMLPDNPDSKATACAQNVYEIWKRTAPQKSAQMVFCDLSTPHYDGSFNVYDDIKDKLLAKGIPETEIAFIHDANTELQKKEMFAKVRNGQIRVLMGSTARMGAGTNAQNKLIALHHVDCPWRPSDLQQREGRIIRQGNENPTVEIYSYVTEQTFDAYLYQLVESKQKFISQIMTSKSPVRSAEDVDETALSYAEIKALATGNPMIKEKMDLDIAVSKLKLLKSSHLSQKYSLEDQIIKHFPRQIAENMERIEGYVADQATVAEHTNLNEDGFSPMELVGTTYPEKKAAGSELLAICQNMLTPDATVIGAYRGLTLELSYDSYSKEYRLAMIGQLRHSVSLGMDIYGNIQRMDNALETLPVKEQTCKEHLEELYKQLEIAKVEVQKPFAKEDELKEKTARLYELNTLLNIDGKEKDDGGIEEKSKDKEYER